MYQAIIIGHVLVGLSVIGLVLMQHGKGADAGAAFGSGSSGTVFGAQGSASFLSTTTAVLAAVFFSTSLGLAILSGNTGSDADIMDTPVVEVQESEMPIIDGEQLVVDEPLIIESDIPEVVGEEGVIIEGVVTEEGVPAIQVEEDVVTP